MKGLSLHSAGEGEQDRLLTVAEVAQLLRVSPRWVYERTRTGRIPVRKLGGSVRIPLVEFQRWIDAQSIPRQRQRSATPAPDASSRSERREI